MNQNIPKHPKLEKARIISNILSCYSNKDEVTVPIVSREEFTKSLSEGDKFFEKKAILDAIEKAQKNNTSLDDLNKLISKSEKKIVKDGLKSTEVYVVKAEDIDSEDDDDEEDKEKVEKSNDDDSDDEMGDEGEGSEDDSEEEVEEVEKACMDLKKAENLDIAKGGKRGQIGEIRTYNGKQFQKQASGKWLPYKIGGSSNKEKPEEKKASAEQKQEPASSSVSENSLETQAVVHAISKLSFDKPYRNKTRDNLKSMIETGKINSIDLDYFLKYEVENQMSDADKIKVKESYASVIKKDSNYADLTLDQASKVKHSSPDSPEDIGSNQTHITFATQKELNLWNNEMSGQISDGQWENSSNTKWIWGATTSLGPETKVETTFSAGKKSYPFNSELKDIVGQRATEEAGFKDLKETSDAWKKINEAIKNTSEHSSDLRKKQSDFQAKQKAKKDKAAASKTEALSSIGFKNKYDTYGALAKKIVMDNGETFSVEVKSGLTDSGDQITFEVPSYEHKSKSIKSAISFSSDVKDLDSKLEKLKNFLQTF